VIVCRFGQTDDPAEVPKMMETLIAHNITDGVPCNGHLRLRGEVPEVDPVIKLHRK
jgi:hypothetical protein